jgi:demethylmenaquinone methyltransferase/2-methoxy-6-polyprenyl-1,4-benzoquinol methylase
MPERAARDSAVRDMFDRVAPVYDAMNTVMTLGLDARWRRAAALAAALGPGMAAVDVACGTGALTRRLAAAVQPGGSVVGIDISPAMVDRAHRRPVPGVRYEVRDALDLPLPTAGVDAATIAFGLRNVQDRQRCLSEMARVTRRGGRVVVLELATPRGRIGRLLAATWFERAVPLLGRSVGRGSAYAYLPDSVRRYPVPARIAELMAAAGLREVRWRRLPPGFVTLHVGIRD